MTGDIEALARSLEVIVATPASAIRRDPLLAERVRVAQELLTALDAVPADLAEIEALAERFMALSTAPTAAPGPLQ